ncbi:MAG: hypothetical protein GKS00_29610 [Alphaproteobacteria bacterium]|nr:hypothetical protein [Alphaproteobacteria bacterium]
MEDYADTKTVIKLFAWIAALEAEIATIRQIAEQDDRNAVAANAYDAIRSLERLIVEIALPLRQPPHFAWDLLIQYGQQDFAAHDFKPAEAPTNGPYLDAIWEREEKRRKGSQKKK